MVITPDFGSSNVGSIPAGTTINVSIAEWLKLLPLKEKILSSILSGGTYSPIADRCRQ